MSEKGGEVSLDVHLPPLLRQNEISIRAWRGLRINVEYAAKLAKKSDKEKSKPVSKKNDGAPISNPFSVGPTFMVFVNARPFLPIDDEYTTAGCNRPRFSDI